MRFGLLGIGCYFEVTDEVSAGVVVEDELDELGRRTAAYRVRYVGLCFHVFFAVQVL